MAVRQKQQSRVQRENKVTQKMSSENTIHPLFSETGILFPVLLLMGIGIIMVSSASSSISMEEHNTLYFYMKKQMMFAGIGLVLMAVCASIPYKIYQGSAYVVLLACLVLLLAALVPGWKVSAGGAARWLRVGGFCIQPTEFLKPAMVLFLGYSLAKKQENISLFSIGFVPHFFLFLLVGGLIMLQPDFGTTIVLALIFWGMMFVSGVRFLHLLSPLPLLIPLAYFLVFKVPYRLKRIMGFLHPWDDPYGTGYQITQSLKAFGAGGITGKGLGLGMQKMHYLPEPHTDFIFSILGEELGFIGVCFVLVLYAILLGKGSAIARDSRDMFGKIVATGLILSIGVQCVFNIGVALGVLPTKGLTLPFISYGGSSLLMNMAAAGILMNIGAEARKTKWQVQA